MIDLTRRIFALFSRKEKIQFYFLLALIIMVALAEVGGIASIMPFIAVLSDPGIVERNAHLKRVYEYFQFESVNDFLVYLGFGVFAVLVVSNGLKALAHWLELRFVHYRQHEISRKLLACYLNKPYNYFLNKHSATISKNVLHEVSRFSHEVLRPYMRLLTRVVVVTFIVAFLVIVDPILAVMIVLLLGGSYVLIYLFVRSMQKRLGEIRFVANELRFRSVSEVLGGLKVLKVMGRDKHFFDEFSDHSVEMETASIRSGVIAGLPAFVLEVLAFGGILIIVLVSLIRNHSVGEILPLVALYGFAGYRLLPALHGAFDAFNLMRFNTRVLDVLHDELHQLDPDPEPRSMQGDVEKLEFKKEICLSKVSYIYPGTSKNVLEKFSLTIPRSVNVGLAGMTGAGKTTIVDIILGLLIPTDGELLVDGEPVLGERVNRWQKNVGYVPQSIFLADDSIASNIAFGIPKHQIDMARVLNAAKTANLHEFIETELDRGYDTHVGERGVRLSGGQQQRIGIARALYDDPDVLILDEATSALDGVTEAAVINSLRDATREKTIISIAHRLTTLQHCDVIYLLQNGAILEHGPFSQLMADSDVFRSMARQSEESSNLGAPQT